MNARLCPKCQALIESESAFFCYNCGEVLAEPGSKTTSPEETTEKPLPAEKKRRSGWLVSLTLTTLTVAVLASGLVLFRIQKEALKPSALSPTQNSNLEPPANEFVSTVSAIPVAPFELTGNIFSDILPAEAAFFIRSRSPILLLRRVMSEKLGEEFTKKTGLTLNEAVSFIGEDYAYAEMTEGFAFLSKVKDTDFIRAKLTEFSKEEVRGQLLDDILVVSNSNEILKKVSQAAKKTTLPLSQLTDFSEGRRRLPETGQAFIYTKDSDSLKKALNIFFGGGLDEASVKLQGKAFVVDSVSGSLKITGVYGKN